MVGIGVPFQERPLSIFWPTNRMDPSSSGTVARIATFSPSLSSLTRTWVTSVSKTIKVSGNEVDDYDDIVMILMIISGFSFGSLTPFKSNTIVDFIENAVQHSRSGRYLFFLHRRPERGPMRVQLLYPVSRFKEVQSLQHLCRFVTMSQI